MIGGCFKIKSSNFCVKLVPLIIITLRKQNDIKLGDALVELLDTYQLTAKVDEVKLVDGWGKVLGKMIDNHTQKIWVQHSKLFVKLDSAALKNELSYSKSKIIDSMNEYVGKQLITELIFA